MGIDEQLNAIQPLPYKAFEGRYIDAMPALRADKRVPLTFRQIAGKQLEAVASGNEQMINGWLLNCFDTSDAIAYSGNEIKIVPDCELLKSINFDAKLKNGALVLSENQYKQLNGKTFQHSEFKVNEHLTEQEAKEHPVWQAELGDILEQYTKMVFSEGKKKYGFDNAMKVYLAGSQEKPTLRPFHVLSISGRSNLSSHYNYLDDFSRLVGERDEKIGKKK